MSVNHYENFPVASPLLPARLRPAVRAIYAFARSADDVADEGGANAQQRLQELAKFDAALDQIAQQQTPEDSAFAPLAAVVHKFDLPLQPLRNLLSAFRQDVVTTRYADYETLLDYCRRSANPVGHLMLHLYGAVSPHNLRDADAICTALQLINFWQDVALDWQKDRIYLPQSDLAHFGVHEADIAQATSPHAWRALMDFELSRATDLIRSGAGLTHRLPGRVGWELRFVVQGGLRIAERIEAANYDIFYHRPILAWRDWRAITWRVLTQRPL